MEKVRWGFIGAGDIAEVMAAALAKHTNQRVVAVGSQTPGKGKAFADRFGIERHYDNYADLANDPEVDIVYVATLPHTHLADARHAIRAGKHVLIEKPSTMTAKDTETLYAEAKAPTAPQRLHACLQRTGTALPGRKAPQ